MNDRNKICVIDNSTALTGALRSIIQIVNFLSLEFNFFLLGPHKDHALNSPPSLNHAFFRFYELRKGLTSIFLYLPGLIWNALKLVAFLNSNKISILHVNDLYNMCGIIIKLMRPRTKVIYHIRLLPSSYVRKLYKVWQYLILKLADEIICVSEAVASHWPKRDNIHVIYDAVGFIENLPERVIKNSDPVTFLYLANYIQGKGHDTALHAFQKVHQKNPNVRLRMVGSDMGLKKNQEFKDGLRQFILRHDLIEVVSLEDFSENVEALMKQVDVFLNFSESESFSMTCLEALYFGTPCIATASGGPSEIIEDGVSGLLVPVGDVAKMTEAMLGLASDVEKRKSFSQKGRLRARTVFSIQTQAAKLSTIYKS